MVTVSLCDGSLDHVTWNAITEEGVHKNNFLFPVENWLHLSRSQKFILGLRVQMSQLIWDWIQRGLTKKAINTLKCNHKILNGFLLRQNDINFWRNEGWQYWGLEWQIGILLWVWGWYYRMEGRGNGLMGTFITWRLLLPVPHAQPQCHSYFHFRWRGCGGSIEQINFVCDSFPIQLAFYATYLWGWMTIWSIYFTWLKLSERDTFHSIPGAIWSSQTNFCPKNMTLWLLHFTQ